MRSELENLRVCGFRDRLNNTCKYSAIRVDGPDCCCDHA